MTTTQPDGVPPFSGRCGLGDELGVSAGATPLPRSSAPMARFTLAQAAVVRRTDLPAAVCG